MQKVVSSCMELTFYLYVKSKYKQGSYWHVVKTWWMAEGSCPDAFLPLLLEADAGSLETGSEGQGSSWGCLASSLPPTSSSSILLKSKHCKAILFYV